MSLKRSNRILQEKLASDFNIAAQSLGSPEFVGFLDYLTLMDLLGYSHHVSESTMVLIEDLWVFLSKPNASPTLFEEDSKKLKLSDLFH
jgi:hypothetical protein